MRALAFIGVLLIGFVGPWWLLLIAAPLYAFRYRAYELLFIGFLLDLSYGAGGTALAVYYTLSFAVLIVLMAVIKPRLNFGAHASL